MKVHMHSLSRLTTQYDVAQDRIRIAGEVKEGQTVVLWLTQRLVNRMVAHVGTTLEKPEPLKPKALAVQAQLKQSFAQQRARSQMRRTLPPVKPDELSPQWLVHKVNIKSGPDGMRLVFQGEEMSEQVALGMGFTPLRQWLGILHDQYRLAGWSTGMWPTWVSEPALPPKPSTKNFLH